MDRLNLNVIVESLLKAEKERKPIKPLTQEIGGMTVKGAYDIQLKVVSSKVAAGHKVIGKKIGLTSRGMQETLGVKEPDYGHLLDYMFIDKNQIDINKLIQPKVEAEVAFVLKEKLMGPRVTTSDVLIATEGIMPAMEIVDSRIENWQIKLADTIADNASSGYFVLGDKMYEPKEVNLKTLGMVFYKNGEMINSGTCAEVMGNPVVSVAWLANKLSEFGICLDKGEIILSGGITAAVNATKNDVFTVLFDTLGTIILKFL